MRKKTIEAISTGAKARARKRVRISFSETIAGQDRYMSRFPESKLKQTRAQCRDATGIFRAALKLRFPKEQFAVSFWTKRRTLTNY
jgi:hypothetical protein